MVQESEKNVGYKFFFLKFFLEKLKKRFNIDIKQNYIQININPNPLFLNKKIYLLYNYWNKGKEFIPLISENHESKRLFNYIAFVSLDVNFQRKLIGFDYFNKWSSSYLEYSDLILKKYLDLNREKDLIDCSYSLDYTIFDNVFLNYIVNDKKNFFFLNKNAFIFECFFKLSKREFLKLKEHKYMFMFNDYLLLNKNYNDKIFINNWKNKYKAKYINNLWYLFSMIYKKNIMKKINDYYFSKINNILFFIKNNYYLFLKNNIIYKKKSKFFFHFIRRKEIKKLLLFKKYFQHLYYTKRINRRLFGYKLRLKKGKGLVFFKKRFISMLRHHIFKSLKKKRFYSFLNKYKNRNIFARTFLSLRNIVYNENFRDKKLYIKKEKKLREHRITKKLKTFYYIPDTNRTREQVYKRFFKSVIRKYRRRRFNRIKGRNTGLRFNLSLYNIRNRYNHRKRAMDLKTKVTRPYHFFKRKKNIYANSKNERIDLRYYELPPYVFKKYKLNFYEDYIKKRNKRKKKKKNNIFLKKEDWKLYKFYKKISRKPYVQRKKSWLYLYNNKGSLLKRSRFLKYVHFFMEKRKEVLLTKEKNRRIFVRRINNTFNEKWKKKKKAFWFFQQALSYWKNIINIKKNKNKFSNILYIKKNYLFFFDLFLSNFRWIIIEFIKIFKLYRIGVWRRRKRRNTYMSYFNKIIFLLKYHFIYYLQFIRKIKKKRLKKKVYSNKKFFKILKKKYFFIIKKYKKKRKIRYKLNYKKKKKTSLKKNNNYYSNYKGILKNIFNESR